MPGFIENRVLELYLEADPARLPRLSGPPAIASSLS